MSYYKKELEKMMSKLDDIAERYEDDGIDNYEELVDELYEVEVEFDEMKSGFEMEDDCEFLLRRAMKKLAYLRENMDVFDPDGELESMFDDEDLEDMRNIH